MSRIYDDQPSSDPPLLSPTRPFESYHPSQIGNSRILTIEDDDDPFQTGSRPPSPPSPRLPPPPRLITTASHHPSAHDRHHELHLLAPLASSSSLSLDHNQAYQQQHPGAPPSSPYHQQYPLQHPAHQYESLASSNAYHPTPSPPAPPQSGSSPSLSALSRPPSPLYPPHPRYNREHSPSLSSGRSPPSSELPFLYSQTRNSQSTWHTESDRTLRNESPFSPPTKLSQIMSSSPPHKFEDETETTGFVYPAAHTAVAINDRPRPVFKSEAHPAVPHNRRRRNMIALIAVLLIILAIIIGVVVATRKSRSADQLDGSTNTLSAQGQLWGVGGDRIKTDDGTSFIYNNTLGGTWVAIPFNDTARAQDDSPPLNQPWNYAHQRIFGVNLGGWLVLEPFITPYMFEPFNPDTPSSATPTVVDEWTLSAALGNSLASKMEEHYRTFITEKDFAEIAAAGLNWVRLPVGWWMIETWPGEPFLAKVSFKYFLKAINWARKYGLRINLDLHAVPGSQNGYNHSGRLGSINFLVGLMGLANAQRSLNYIRTLTQFISEPEYSNVVPMFTVLNEPIVQRIGSPQIRALSVPLIHPLKRQIYLTGQPDLLLTPFLNSYLQVYKMMRDITGLGRGKGPMMVIHDGFQGQGAGHLGWGGFLKGADRLGLDTHTYFAFDKQSNDSMGYNAYKPCTYWAKSFNQTNTEFGFNFAGEYSLAINDCGLWLNNIGFGARYDGTYPNSTAPDVRTYPAVGSCESWRDYRTWSDELKGHLADLAFASQDAMQNSFFWTWKISNSTRAKDGLKPNPLWDYQLGLKEGWIRPDARKSVGGCAVATAKEGAPTPTQAWSGEFEDWQVGTGNVTGTIDPGELARYGQWPPAQVATAPGASSVYDQVNNLPHYVPSGPIVVLKPEPPQKIEAGSQPTGSGGDGWYNDNDKAGWYVPINNCQYPDPWNAGGLPAPTGPFCGDTIGSNRRAK